MTRLRIDKEMGSFWTWFWLVLFWGAREVLGLMEEKESSRSTLSPPPSLEPLLFEKFGFSCQHCKELQISKVYQHAGKVY